MLHSSPGGFSPTPTAISGTAAANDEIQPNERQVHTRIETQNQSAMADAGPTTIEEVPCVQTMG